MKPQKLFWGAKKANKAQIKFYSSTLGNLGQAVLLGSGGFLLLGERNLFLGIAGVIVSIILIGIAARLLKEVKDL